MHEYIPQELKQLNHWVCWKAELDETRPGKIRKIPVNAKTGGQAQSNNRETWADYQTALAASVNFNGVGFMFGDGYFGVDIDGVEDAIEDYKNGIEDSNIIYEFIHTLCSYSEYSISGKGIHIICKGALPPAGRRKNNVEMYSEGRFFIMTGKLAAEYLDITDCSETIKTLHEKYIGGGKEPTTGIVRGEQLNLSEADVIKLASASRQGAMFSDLYDGNWQSYFQSQSEADMSFCNMLAFWCGRDEQIMDHIFRSSGLMRTKWDRKQSGSTYGLLTIAKAVRECRTVYEPKAEYSIKIGAAKLEEKKLYTFDDTGNAERFSDTFQESIKYSYINKAWYYYDGRKWCSDNTGSVKRMSDEVIEEMRHDLKRYIGNISDAEDEEEIEKQFMKHLKYSRSSKAKNAMIRETEHRLPVLPEQMDKHSGLLNTLNGTINLKNGELLAHDHKRLISKMACVEYTDKIDYPLWEAFLNDIFHHDQELIRYVQKAVGYSLTGSTQEQCAFFCYGTGRNGKSTFIDTIGDILGDYAVNVQPETLMVKNQGSGANSDIARLKGARFVTSVEPNEGMRLNEGLLKQLTGGDRVTARFQYGSEFEFTPEFKLWMGTNHKPIIRGTDTGIWRRVHLIPFMVQIPENKIDRRLKYKLKAELPGILKWAVDGCLLWQQEGLKKPKAVEDAVKEYKGEMDVLSAFVEACCQTGAGEEKSGSLYQAYSKWAEENNEYRMSSTKFGIEMSKQFEKTRRKDSFYYQNILLSDAYKPYGIKFGCIDA